MKKEEKAKKDFVRRLREFIADTGMSNRAFCINAGISEHFIKTCSGNPNANNKALILKAYPQLNWDWLETGEGSMYKEGAERIVISNIKARNIVGRDQYVGMDKSSMKEEIAALRAKLAASEARIASQQELIDKLLAKLGI